MPHELRPLAPADVPHIRAFLDAEVARVPYAARAREFVEAAALGGEYHALVAVRGGAPVGVVVYGIVAGTEGAGAVYSVFVQPSARRGGLGATLVGGATAALARAGARSAIVEPPDDAAALAGAAELFAEAGFAETARVSDLYRDGVALAFWQRPL
jgi:ribosomal protein S18 acetylase RimI-like enzyme